MCRVYLQCFFLKFILDVHSGNILINPLQLSNDLNFNFVFFILPVINPYQVLLILKSNCHGNVMYCVVDHLSYCRHTILTVSQKLLVLHEKITGDD